jgi:hypothetical protein
MDIRYRQIFRRCIYQDWDVPAFTNLAISSSDGTRSSDVINHAVFAFSEFLHIRNIDNLHPDILIAWSAIREVTGMMTSVFQSRQVWAESVSLDFHQSRRQQ